MTELAATGAAPAPSDPAPAPEVGRPAPTPNPENGALKWYTDLPENFRNDPTITRFDTLTAVAESLLEAKRAMTAGDRLILPAADASPEDWGAIFDKLGRPETTDAYEIPVIEGDAGDYAAAFRPVAHALGLNAAQAKGLAEWQNSMLTAQAEARDVEAVEALAALKKVHGAAFPQYEAQAIAGFEAFRDVMGGPVDPNNPDAHAANVMALADKMTSVIGQAAFVNLWAEIGKRMGEAPRIEGDPPNGLAIDGDAKAILDAKMKDTAWMAKFAAGDTETVAERARLVEAVKQQALRKANGGA